MPHRPPNLPAGRMRSRWTGWFRPAGTCGPVGSSSGWAPPGPGRQTGWVRTLVGQGLFDFGDVDGQGAVVRLQHPLGVAWGDGFLYIADSYNHKIKRLDPTTAECRTIAGDGKPGLMDGEASVARFCEPSGLAMAGDRVFIADPNNHAVRVLDLARGQVSTLPLSGLTPP